MGYEKRSWKGELAVGTYAFCACGESQNKPYCDGSHSRNQTGKTPHVCPIAELKTYSICQCGTTSTPPFCDGSHKKLPPD